MFRSLSLSSVLLGGLLAVTALAGLAVFLLPMPMSAIQTPGWALPSLFAVAMLALVVFLDQRVRRAERLEARLRDILEASPESIVAVNPDGRIVYANPQTAQLFGYALDEMIGQAIDRFLPPAYRESTLLSDGSREEGSPHTERFGKHKDGRDIVMQVSQTSTPGAAGDVITLFLRDHTRNKNTRDALLQREASLQLIVSQMPAILWTTDKDLQVTSSMGAGLAALHLRPEHIIGLPLAENLARQSEDSTPIAAHLRAARGESLSYEMDWKDRTFQVRVEPLRNSSKKITGTIGIVLDVTDRKQAMLELKARVRQQAAVAQLGQRALEGLERDRLMSEAAQLVAETLDVEFSQVYEAAPGERGLKCRATVGSEKCPAAGFDLHAAYTLARNRPVLLDDATATDEGTGRRLLADNGIVTGIGTVIPGKASGRGVLSAYTRARRQFTAEDIHFLQALAHVLATTCERREAEAAQNRLVAILEATPDFVAIAGVDRQVLYINRAGREKVGLEPHDSLPALSAFYPEPAAAALLGEQLPTAIARGVCEAESVLRDRRGAEIPVAQLVLAHRSDTGDVAFFSIIGRDLRDRRHLEEQFRQAQKMEAVGRLAGGVAHDFNNLLCVINGYSDLLLHKLPASNENHGLVSEIKKAGDRAASLTRQLLTFSRKQVAMPSVLNLNTLIVNMEKMLRRLIGEHIELSTVLAPDLESIQADPGQMEQVLMNLVINARDAMPTGGRLSLTTSVVRAGHGLAPESGAGHAGAFVLLAVRDTGCGMEEAVKAHLFEPFFTTKGVGKGTGLGLATVYGIVKGGGGHVDVQSQPGQGTNFSIYWPVAAKTSKASASEPVTKPTMPGKETILLVEDEEPVRTLSRRILEQAGYTVLEARDGDHACEICETYPNSIHLLVSDVVMPKISGGKLVKRVAPFRPHMKVLFVSGYSDSALVQHGVAKGEVECLLKPFTPEALAAKVREVLDSRRPNTFVKDRRIATRRRLLPSVKVECRHAGGPNIAVEALNLSEKGMALHVNSRPEKGQEVEIVLHGPAPRLTRMAVVMWVRSIQGVGYHVGIRFYHRIVPAEFAALTVAPQNGHSKAEPMKV